MTATVTEVTTSAILSMSYLSLSASLGAIAFILLLILLVMKEMLRTLNVPRRQERMRVIEIAIPPLLLAFIFVILVRMMLL